MYTDYQLYLFSQLFHEILNDCIEASPYDLLFPIIQNELNVFLKSHLNTDLESEYDCMYDYLVANSDVISIQLADHNDI